MKQDLVRFTNLMAKIATDRAFGGLRDLFQALSEERARRFVSWLSSTDDGKQQSAESSIRALINHPQGEVLVRHICRDVLFGTETISLAALALITCQAATNADDPFCSRAAKAIDGIANEDTLAFLAILKNTRDLHIHLEWRPICFFDLKVITESHWRDFVSVLGLGAEQVHTGISSCVQRKLFLPDTASGRMAGEGEYAVSSFALSADTARYYRLLARAVEIAEPVAFNALVPFDPERVDRLCSIEHWKNA